jgi:hypothetical protein
MIGKPVRRSGRVLSAESEAQLREALDHLEQAIAAVQQVLDSNDQQVTIENSWSQNDDLDEDDIYRPQRPR